MNPKDLLFFHLNRNRAVSVLSTQTDLCGEELMRAPTAQVPSIVPRPSCILLNIGDTDAIISHDTLMLFNTDSVVQAQVRAHVVGDSMRARERCRACMTQ